MANGTMRGLICLGSICRLTSLFSCDILNQIGKAGDVMLKGTIFDIKGFALSDGPGIRTTVFLKGCPLRCLWCHNPEGLSPKPELRVKMSRCTGCGKCRLPCDHADCKPFGRCLHICPFGNVTAAGTEYTPEELAAILLRDRDVFGNDGGVTFSGGEPLMQADFLAECASILRREGVHTAIETSSYAPPAVYDRVTDAVDYVLCDIKLMDSEKHKKYCGVDNAVILENLSRLMKKDKEMLFRIPLIPGITDTDENLAAIADFIKDRPVELLTYNDMAGAKYSSVGREYTLGHLRRSDIERERVMTHFSRAVMK